MKIEFNLGWIAAIAAAIGVSAMGFMSFYYRTGGTLLWPIIVAICLLVLPIVVNMFLVPAKECSKPFYFHSAAVKETALLGAMLVLFIASMLLINHFFTVNGRTETIASAVTDQRKQLDEMQESYSKHVDNRTNNYRAYLNEVLTNKDHDMATYNRVFPDGSSDIEVMVRTMKNKISLDGLNDSIDGVYGSEKIRWWQLPSVMNNVEGISTALENSYNMIVQRDHNDTIDHIAQNDYWDYTYTTAGDIISNFTTPAGFISSPWTIVSMLIAYLLIMLRYLAADRDSRSKGLFAELRKKGKDDEDDNLVETGTIGKL